ncbi:MAG TPA: energy transducer TonB [Bacteroidia bacterium]|jgi:TonB family protein|nr:energy transducer TonB [Bacteroidia bacterium]
MTTITQQNTQEKKDRAIAAVITLGISAVILLLLILIKIITPLPPFPEMAGGGGQEVNFGIYNEGTGNVEGPGIGDATSVVVESKSSPVVKDNAGKEEDFKNGEQVLEKDNSKPKMENNETVIVPVKPNKEPKKDNSASNLLNAYTHNKSTSGQTGGDGNSGNAGNEGSPDGNPNTDGKGGSGGGPDGQVPGTGPGTHGGPGGVSFGLGGRKMLNPPPKVSDSKEEGVVVVIITVDKDGNVIDADANGKGTNTSSATLKSKARQAAKLAKFSPSAQYETQKGTIVFKFQF